MALFKFVYESDYDRFGFRPERHKYFDPGDGLTITHDAFEHHFPRDTGEARFEIMAFGAAIYCRPGGWYEKDNMGEVFGQALVEEMDRYAYNHPLMRDSGLVFQHFDPIKTKPLGDEWAEGVIDDFLKHIKVQLDAGLYYSRMEEKEDAYRPSQGWYDQFHNLRAWCRMGYRYAQNRFRETFQENVRGSWSSLYEKANAAMMRGEPGQVLLVRMDNKRPHLFQMQVVYDYELSESQDFY